MDNYIEKKFPGLKLLENPKCAKKTSAFFKKTRKAESTETCGDVPSKNLSDLFREELISKIQNVDFPLESHERCDPLKTLLEAAYYQFACRTTGIEPELDST